MVVNKMTDDDVKAIASEPTVTKRQREFLEDRVRKLEDGHEIFRGVMAGGDSIGILTGSNLVN